MTTYHAAQMAVLAIQTTLAPALPGSAAQIANADLWRLVMVAAHAQVCGIRDRHVSDSYMIR